MVQNGKLEAAAWLFVKTLKKVDFLQIILVQNEFYIHKICHQSMKVLI